MKNWQDYVHLYTADSPSQLVFGLSYAESGQINVVKYAVQPKFSEEDIELKVQQALKSLPVFSPRDEDLSVQEQARTHLAMRILAGDPVASDSTVLEFDGGILFKPNTALRKPIAVIHWPHKDLFDIVVFDSLPCFGVTWVDSTATQCYTD